MRDCNERCQTEQAGICGTAYPSICCRALNNGAQSLPVRRRRRGCVIPSSKLTAASTTLHWGQGPCDPNNLRNSWADVATARTLRLCRSVPRRTVRQSSRGLPRRRSRSVAPQMTGALMRASLFIFVICGGRWAVSSALAGPAGETARRPARHPGGVKGSLGLPLPLTKQRR